MIPEGADESVVVEKMNRFVKMAHEFGDYIPTGVFLANRSVSTFAQRYRDRIKSYGDFAPGDKVTDTDGIANANLNPIFDELAVN